MDSCISQLWLCNKPLHIIRDSLIHHSPLGHFFHNLQHPEHPFSSSASQKDKELLWSLLSFISVVLLCAAGAALRAMLRRERKTDKRSSPYFIQVSFFPSPLTRGIGFLSGSNYPCHCTIVMKYCDYGSSRTEKGEKKTIMNFHPFLHLIASFSYFVQRFKR